MSPKLLLLTFAVILLIAGASYALITASLPGDTLRPPARSAVKPAGDDPGIVNPERIYKASEKNEPSGDTRPPKKIHGKAGDASSVPPLPKGATPANACEGDDKPAIDPEEAKRKRLKKIAKRVNYSTRRLIHYAGRKSGLTGEQIKLTDELLKQRNAEIFELTETGEIDETTKEEIVEIINNYWDSIEGNLDEEAFAKFKKSFSGRDPMKRYMGSSKKGKKRRPRRPGSWGRKGG